MLTFKKIKWKNFLSTGDHWTEVNFQECHTNIVIGTNGAGKSTMLDALTFVLFNKPFRKINKLQLINTVNEKDCCVEIEFNVNFEFKNFLFQSMMENLFSGAVIKMFNAFERRAKSNYDI